MNVILLVNGNFFLCRQLFKKRFSDRICWYTLFNVGRSFTLYRVFSQEADGALILPPSFHQCSVLRVFKATWATLKGRSRNRDVRSGDRTRDLLHQGRALTACATLAPFCLHLVMAFMIIKAYITTLDCLN